jgi:hypothetical protein
MVRARRPAALPQPTDQPGKRRVRRGHIQRTIPHVLYVRNYRYGPRRRYPAKERSLTALELNSPTETFAFSRKNAALGYFEQVEPIVICVCRAQSTPDRIPAIAIRDSHRKKKHRIIGLARISAGCLSFSSRDTDCARRRSAKRFFST